MVYDNVDYKSEAAEASCLNPRYNPGGVGCDKVDWPDFPDYIINYHIVYRDQRCTSGFTFQYATGVCKAVVIQ